MDLGRWGVLACLLTGCLLGVWGWVRHRAVTRGPNRPTGRPRVLHPRTPQDCPCCRHQGARPLHRGPDPPPVRPWRDGTSRRGRPRRISTQGYACPTPTCAYYGITESTLHALVGDGHHGKATPIQNFRCQACGTKVTERYGTPLYRLRTPVARVGEVLSALAEGLDVAAAVRVFGHGEATITRWRDGAGQQARRLHERLLRHLHLPHIQVDEIRTRLRQRTQVVWLWLAVDPLTKLVPVFHLGPRTQESAHALIWSCPGLVETFKLSAGRRCQRKTRSHQWQKHMRRIRESSARRRSA